MEQRISELLQNADTIAVVGMSDSPMRDSNRIGELLIDVGYRVYPVNPTINSVHGLHSWPDVKSVPDQVDIVDVFRNSRYAKEVVLDAIEAGAKAIWFQYGAEDPEAEGMAREAGLEVISGYCIAVEIRRRGINRQLVD
ncbi:MAG: CoA-binding protein [Candidatus Kapaibacterium sp.]